MNKEKIARTVRLVRTVGLPIALFGLNITALLLPKPWDDVAARAMFTVVALWFAPLAGQAIADWIFVLMGIKKSQYDAARLDALLGECKVDLDKYVAWRKRIIAATYGLRGALAEQGMQAMARDLEPLIVEMSADIDFTASPPAVPTSTAPAGKPATSSSAN